MHQIKRCREFKRYLRLAKLSRRTRPRSRVQVEYEEAQSKYEEFRQGLIAERRARRRHGIRQPPLSGIPELASAAATLNQKLDAVVEEMNAVWDAAEREYLSRASK